MNVRACPSCEEFATGGFGGAFNPGMGKWNRELPPTPVPPVAATTTTPPPAGPAANSPPPEVKLGADGYWRVSFQNLASFTFTAPPPDAPPRPGSVESIPASVQSLDGKQVCVSGFMLPVKTVDGLVTEFLLIRNSMLCCYGIMPAPNEWVIVKMKGKGTSNLMDVPLNFYGTLHVGEIYEGGMFAGIYQLDGEKVSAN